VDVTAGTRHRRQPDKAVPPALMMFRVDRVLMIRDPVCVGPTVEIRYPPRRSPSSRNSRRFIASDSDYITHVMGLFRDHIRQKLQIKDVSIDINDPAKI
jgi:hypothetical protein